MSYMDRYLRQSSALLPTGTRMNPAQPDGAKFFESDQYAYVVKNVDTGALRVLTSFGHVGEAWEVGTLHSIHHDQSLRHLGYWEVVGTHDYKTGVTTGEVPDKKLGHWVFK